MNIRDAILAAASHIERDPSDFDFSCSLVPSGCGSPGCALGWIGHYLNAGLRIFSDTAEKHMGMANHYTFYQRMTECEVAGGIGCASWPAHQRTSWESGEWSRNAAICARVLRLYADAHHPATERPLQYPNWHAIATAPLDEADAAETLLRAAIRERRSA